MCEMVLKFTYIDMYASKMMMMYLSGPFRYQINLLKHEGG